MKKQFTNLAFVLILLVNLTASNAQNAIVGFSPLFQFNTQSIGSFTGYSELFSYNTNPSGGFSSLSGIFAFNTEPAQAITAFSDLFIFNTIQEVQGSAVTFNITDMTGNSVQDAVIVFGGIENEAGDYVFEGIINGTYLYEVSSLCYLDVDGEINIDQDTVIEIVLENNPGDSNGDGIINVLDVIIMGNFYTGDVPENFCFINADVNADGAVNILDIIATINIYSSGKISPFIGLESDTAMLFFTEEGVFLESDGTITGVQIEISGIKTDVAGIISKLPGHELMISLTDEKIKLLMFSLNNTPIAKGRVQLLLFDGDFRDAQLDLVVAANLNADRVPVEFSSEEITGLSHFSDKDLYRIFPNPARNVLYIEAMQTIGNVRLMDVNGRIMAEKEVDGYAAEFNLSQIPAGMYFVEIFLPDTRKTARVHIIK